jgi:hypothetical protein
MPQQPVNGGPMDGMMPQEMPPEEGGPQPFEPPVDLTRGMPNGPMSGTGEQLAQYSPKGIDVAGDIKLTEGQSKDLGFWNRMDGVESSIQGHEGDLTSGSERLKDAIPLVGNALVSGDFQVARGDSGEWIAALLRKDTGASVTPVEWKLYGPIYIPQYGDKPVELEAKRARRKRAAEAIKKGLGLAEILADELKAGRAQTEAPPADDADAELFKKYGIE